MRVRMASPLRSFTSFAAGLALVGGLALAPLPARAGEKEVKAAESLTRLVMPPEQYAKTIEQMTTQMLAAARQGGQKVPADAEKLYANILREALPYEDMIRWTAEVYGARFTVAELEDLKRFYKTPTGKKLVGVLPELMGEVGRKTAQMIPERLPAVMRKYGIGGP